MKFLGRCLVLASYVLVVAVLFVNVRLYWPSPLAQESNVAPKRLAAMLANNRSMLNRNAAVEMQALFPEGYYFSYLFHGLTWIELAIRDHSFAQQAIEEASWCLSKLETTEGRAPFPPSLPPDHGMFYSAWKCSLRSGIVLLQNGKNQNELESLQKECDAIAAAIENSRTPFLPSYENSAWPCDTLPAIHALSVFDRITREDRYREVIASWLKEVRQRLDPETGLLPHTASMPTGQTGGVARATSQMIILRYLPDIDADLAKDQYERFRQRFLSSFFSLPSVLEYPSGTSSGAGDVDSGPLIMGRSLSATVLMIGVAQIYGDQDLANAIAQVGETVGIPWTYQGRKSYFGNGVPIGNIMVAYAYAAKPWFAQHEHQPTTAYRIPWYWRWPTHAASFLICLPVILIAKRRYSRRKVLASDDQVVA